MSVAALMVIGLFDVLIAVTRQSVVQLATPGRIVMGRVMGTYRMVSVGLGQFAQTQSGLL